jgi:hypothetical protein
MPLWPTTMPRPRRCSAGAVGATRALVDLEDQVGQPGMADRAGRRRAGPPGVVARGRHVQDPQATSTGMCSAVLTATASNRLLGHHLSDQLHRPTHRMQLGLQLGDPPLGRDQLGLLATGQARLKTPIDAALPAGVDQLIAEIPSACATSATGRPASTRSSTLRRNPGGYPHPSPCCAPILLGSTESNNTTPPNRGKNTLGVGDLEMCSAQSGSPF